MFIFVMALLLIAVPAHGTPKEHKFKSPSFSGINQSSHYLTIENQETSRKEAIKQEIEDLKKQLERDAENTTLAKFIRNVESRIYSTLSRQLVESMFGENPSNEGSFNIEGTGITYVKDGDKVKKVSFGDTTGLSIKRDDPARRKAFRARHNCDTAKDKTTARYWSCYQWRANAPVNN